MGKRERKVSNTIKNTILKHLWRDLLVEKQEIYSLCVADRLEKKYIRAFLEIFESGYAPHVGDVERIANKKGAKTSYYNAK